MIRQLHIDCAIQSVVSILKLSKNRITYNVNDPAIIGKNIRFHSLHAIYQAMMSTFLVLFGKASVISNIGVQNPNLSMTTILR